MFVRKFFCIISVRAKACLRFLESAGVLSFSLKFLTRRIRECFTIVLLSAWRLTLLGSLRRNFIAFSEQVTVEYFNGNRYIEVQQGENIMCRSLGKRTRMHLMVDNPVDNPAGMFVLASCCADGARKGEKKRADATLAGIIFLIKQELILILLL